MFGRRAVVAVHDAEMALLVASQRAARRAAVQAIDAALSARHGSAIAAIVARYADRRSGISGLSDAEKAAALRQLAADEAHELARLTLEHAAEKRAMRNVELNTMSAAQKTARRSLRSRNRRQRIVIAVQQQPVESRDQKGSVRGTASAKRTANRRPHPIERA